MALAFRHVSIAPLVEFDAAAPDGAVIGVVGENGAGKSVLARLAGGAEQPVSGEVDVHGGARLLGPDDPLNLAPAPVLAIDHTFARHDLLVRERAAAAINRLNWRRAATRRRSWALTASTSPRECVRGEGR
ncbi:MAG: ATP-binding cassette domain-containing protein [Bryobacteraceae bacterium]